MKIKGLRRRGPFFMPKRDQNVTSFFLVKYLDGPSQVLRSRVSIPHRHPQVTMPEKLLRHVNIHAGLDEIRCKVVPEKF